ncbi:BA75_00772T0 [Komagataella pastoris]|uniref:BA75_00772T0 n=1 Tax=Komagataella pastoris TaxID=4922 RepID=A0A1B2J5Z1_PICPA|nr:BA75_00772T0 [Komagataella pastoris]
MVVSLSQFPSPPNSSGDGCENSSTVLPKDYVKRTASPLDPQSQFRVSPNSYTTSTKHSTPGSSHENLSGISVTGVLLPSIDSLARSISYTGRDTVPFNLSSWTDKPTPVTNPVFSHYEETPVPQSATSSTHQNISKHAKEFPPANGPPGWSWNSQSSMRTDQPLYPGQQYPPQLQQHYHFASPRQLSCSSSGMSSVPFQQPPAGQLQPQVNSMLLHMPFSLNGPPAAGQQMIPPQGLPSISVGPGNNNSLFISQGAPAGYPLASPALSPVDATFEDPVKRLPKKRTKTGCLTCRKRRIKCDERKPFCFNCEKSKKVCTGFTHLFKDPPSKAYPLSPDKASPGTEGHPVPPRENFVEMRGSLNYIIN